MSISLHKSVIPAGIAGIQKPEVLQAKLHKALLEAKARLEFQREGDGDE
jgi:hypothetical protein